jgi:hypothetical protein
MKDFLNYRFQENKICIIISYIVLVARMGRNNKTPLYANFPRLSTHDSTNGDASFSPLIF